MDYMNEYRKRLENVKDKVLADENHVPEILAQVSETDGCGVHGYCP